MYSWTSVADRILVVQARVQVYIKTSSSKFITLEKKEFKHTFHSIHIFYIFIYIYLHFNSQCPAMLAAVLTHFSYERLYHY